ncbi:MAG: AraC family transcriptional regulator [Clostridia bacterium]|nr:AraC family transcriptional regulator [Clostridia bacterium]
MIYNEILERGTADFPASYYFVDKGHPRYEMSAHWHSEIEFIRVLSGELTVKLNTNTYKATAGDVFFVNSQTVHAATPHGCIYECIVMHLDYFKTKTENCRHFIESLYNQEYFVTEYSSSPESTFTKAINGFFDAMKEEKEGREFLALGALYNMLGVILAEKRYTALGRGTASASDLNVPKLKKVLSFIRENYDAPITLSDMAEMVGMSGKYFCYFFKNMTGKTPNSYLVSYRIERAAQKLMATDESVTEIAYSCGFNDLSYFIKTFKAHKGVSPGTFRK